MTVSSRTEKMGDTTVGARPEPRQDGERSQRPAPVGQPIDAGDSPGSGKSGGGYVPVGPDPFAAPKPGRSAGD